jgi:hypothetical protein
VLVPVQVQVLVRVLVLVVSGDTLPRRAFLLLLFLVQKENVWLLFHHALPTASV